jgi:hypothetical protein
MYTQISHQNIRKENQDGFFLRHIERPPLKDIIT